jgi:hypothetical protein
LKLDATSVHIHAGDNERRHFKGVPERQVNWDGGSTSETVKTLAKHLIAIAKHMKHPDETLATYV